eukprot:m.88035 g.88035  ORF g.88035 m.88035 type:complete len:591 (-) comp15159_c0_seq1:1727-3499(-)
MATVVTLHRADASSSFGFALKGSRYPYYIEHVSEGGIAATAGLNNGAVVTHINGTDLRGTTLFQAIKMVKSAGNTLALTLVTDAALIASLTDAANRQCAMLRIKVVSPAVLAAPRAVSPTLASPRSRSFSMPERKNSSDRDRRAGTFAMGQPSRVARKLTDVPTVEVVPPSSTAEGGDQAAEGSSAAVPASSPSRSSSSAAAIAAAAAAALRAMHGESDTSALPPQSDSQRDELADENMTPMPELRSELQSISASPDRVSPATLALEPVTEVVAVGCMSQCGRRHGSINQDNCVYEKIVGSDGEVSWVGAVFDGHGLLGEVAAAAAVVALKEIVASGEFQPAQIVASPKEGMRRVFARLHEAVLATHERAPPTYVYPERGVVVEFELGSDESLGPVYRAKDGNLPTMPVDFGCTAAVALVHRDRLVLGNAGDAALLFCQRTEPGGGDEYQVDLLSVHHTARDEAEMARIDRDFPDKAWATPDGYLSPLDPKLAQCELQLTRSLGHRVLSTIGVVATPTVQTLRLVPGRARALVICSDGVTDELSPRDICERVVEATDATEAARTLCTDAQDFCMEPDRMDDCTTVVMLFK